MVRGLINNGGGSYSIVVRQKVGAVNGCGWDFFTSFLITKALFFFIFAGEDDV